MCYPAVEQSEIIVIADETGPATALFRSLETTGVTMVIATDPASASFQEGWDAAILAARNWHDAQAKQALVQSRRSRFPKNLEREAEFHRQAADMLMTLRPDDV